MSNGERAIGGDGSSPRYLAAAGTVGKVALGCLFIVSGTVKVGGPHLFLADVLEYQLLDRAAAWWVAALVPWFEVAVGCAMLVPPLVVGASFVGAGLSLAFAVAQVTAWVRGLEISCGCFGAIPVTETVGPGSIALAAACGVGFVAVAAGAVRGLRLRA